MYNSNTPLEFERLPMVLALVGAIPFVFLAGGIAFDWFSGSKAIMLFLSYAAVVFAFLAGIHWGIAVYVFEHSPRIARLMLLESTVAGMLAWGILLLDPLYIRLLAFAFFYAFIWGIDSVLHNNRIIPSWFFNVRCVITPIVVVTMYVVFFSVT